MHHGLTTSLVAGNVDRVPHKEALRDHRVKPAKGKLKLQQRPLQDRDAWSMRQPPREATGKERSRLRREDTCATGGRAVGGLYPKAGGK